MLSYFGVRLSSQYVVEIYVHSTSVDVQGWCWGTTHMLSNVQEFDNLSLLFVVREHSSMGHVIQGTFFQGTCHPGDNFSQWHVIQGHSIQGMNRPRTNVGGTSGGDTLSRHRQKHACEPQQRQTPSCMLHMHVMHRLQLLNYLARECLVWLQALSCRNPCLECIWTLNNLCKQARYILESTHGILTAGKQG